MATISLKYRDIPLYLQAGDFYRSLDCSDLDGAIVIPAKYFAPSGKTAPDADQFCQLLRVKSFWILDEIPLGILRFCSQNSLQVWTEAVQKQPNGIETTLLEYLRVSFKPGAFQSQLFQSNRWEKIVDIVSLSPKYDDMTAIATKAKKRQLLTFLHEQGFVVDANTCKRAAEENNLSCLRFAHEQGAPMGNDVCIIAARKGHVTCLRYALENGCKCNYSLYYSMIEYRQMNCVKCAYEHGVLWHLKVSEWAASAGYLECLQYAHENGCPWDECTLEAALQLDHMDCFRYAIENGCPCDASTSYLVCIRGSLELVELLYLHGARWDERCCFAAAQYSNISCLQFLHENGCPWDERTITQAALSGFLAPLRYALENGCPHKQSIVQYLARCGNLQFLQYVVEQHCLYLDENVFLSALLRGNFSCVQYLIDQDCPFLSMRMMGGMEAWELADTIFVKRNPEFLLCMELAVERGWRPNQHFVDYILDRDFHNCSTMCGVEGWL